MVQYNFSDVFYWCVDALKDLAAMWGMTYEEVNVWIFCIVEPIIFVLMVIWITYLILRIRRLKLSLKKT